MPGELVTETFAYDGGRPVTVYLPSSQPEAIVFAGDGQLIAPWGMDLEAAAAPPTMIVGVQGTASADEMQRLREYSPGFEPARFAAHETFVLGDVRDWIASRFGVTLPPDRTAVAGVSASAEFALAVGLRHPDAFGTVFAASPGAGFKPPTSLPGPLPRTYLTAGTEEPFFLDNARRWCDALRAAGADVTMSEPPDEHGGPFWRTEFASMLRWAFCGLTATGRSRSRDAAARLPRRAAARPLR